MAAADRAGTVFMVAENAQYWPEVLTVRDELATGSIGDVVTARAVTFFPPLPDFYGSPDDQRRSDGSGPSGGPDLPWRFSAAATGGGVAIDSGSHWIRPLRLWLGEVHEVVAALGHPFPGMEGESLVRSLMRFDSGVVASFDALLTSAPLAPEVLFRVTGTEGELVIDMAGQVMRYRRGARRGEQVGETRGYFDSYAGQFTDFAAAVLDGVPPAAGPESALGELRAALAMYRSAESGRWEQVWS
jgi:predicted dehydrogenase